MYNYVVRPKENESLMGHILILTLPPIEFAICTVNAPINALDVYSVRALSYGGPQVSRQNLLSHGKTYFLTAKPTFPRQNLLRTLACSPFCKYMIYKSTKAAICLTLGIISRNRPNSCLFESLSRLRIIL